MPVNERETPKHGEEIGEIQPGRVRMGIVVS